MRVLILTDRLFALRERAMLARLEVGLADEGYRAIHAVPVDVVEESGAIPASELFARAIAYPPAGLPFTSGIRAARLADRIRRLEEMEPDEERPIAIVHAFGGSTWDLASALAEELNAALVLEVWRAGLVARASAFRTRAKPFVLIAPDPGIERALRASRPGHDVRLSPWCVHMPDESRHVMQPGRAPTVMIVGSGIDHKAYAAALAGLSDLVREYPDTLIFADAHAAQRAGLWAAARKLGLLGSISLIADLEGRRDLLVEGDMVLQPDASGEQKTATLEAMAAGVPIIAAPDAFNSTLRDGETALLVSPHSASAWAGALRTVASDAARVASLARSAREYVRSERLASVQVRAVLDTYAWLAGPKPIPFANA
jgi:glycosyltransferase involved in cell wall biosynthesis